MTKEGPACATRAMEPPTCRCCAWVVPACASALLLLLLLLGKRLLDFGRGHRDLDSVGFVRKHRRGDDDGTRSHVQESAELGPHGGLAAGRAHLRHLAKLL